MHAKKLNFQAFRGQFYVHTVHLYSNTLYYLLYFTSFEIHNYVWIIKLS